MTSPGRKSSRDRSSRDDGYNDNRSSSRNRPCDDNRSPRDKQAEVTPGPGYMKVYRENGEPILVSVPGVSSDGQVYIINQGAQSLPQQVLPPPLVPEQERPRESGQGWGPSGPGIRPSGQGAAYPSQVTGYNRYPRPPFVPPGNNFTQRPGTGILGAAPYSYNQQPEQTRGRWHNSVSYSYN